MKHVMLTCLVRMLQRSAGGDGAGLGRRHAIPVVGRRLGGSHEASPAESLRTIGLSVTVQERILADFKAASGVGSTSGTAATFPDAQTKILSGSKDLIAGKRIGERLPAVVETKKIEPIRPLLAEELGEYPRHFHQTQSDKWDRKAQITGQIWADESADQIVDGASRL